jgi:hypothetical protein
MKKLAIIALTAGMAFAAAPAYKAATNLGWYVGVGLNGYTGWTEKDVTIPQGSTTSYELDKLNLGWDVFAGYRNTEHFGTELGFTSIGDITYKQPTNSEKVKNENMWDVYYDANFYMPLFAGLEVFVKGGVDYFQGKTTGLTDNPRLHTYGLNFGGGLQYMYQQFGVRATYTDLQTLTHNQRDDFNMPNLLGLDVFYTFS